MEVLLINVDAPEFNIAIRKMYTYYTNKGYEVTLIDGPRLTAYPKKVTIEVDGSNYDIIRASMLFEINRDRFKIVNCEDAIIGGMGSYNPELRLPDEVENSKPFYFPGETVAHGFITRGCVRNCSFCKVPKYEGYLKEYSTLDKIYDPKIHNRIRFYDNNILAWPGHKALFRELIEKNIKCDFNQGLDYRLLDEENMELLSKLNYHGSYIFAFDSIKYKDSLTAKLSLMKKYIPKLWAMRMYLYYNYETMDISELIDRVAWCAKYQILPYVMRDQNCWDAEEPYRTFIIEYTRYCNQPNLFKKMSFLESLPRLTKTESRIRKCEEVYYERIRN